MKRNLVVVALWLTLSLVQIESNMKPEESFIPHRSATRYGESSVFNLLDRLGPQPASAVPFDIAYCVVGAERRYRAFFRDYENKVRL